MESLKNKDNPVPFTVISWCNEGYKYLSKGLEEDCKRFGYNFHLYEVERDFPSLISAWCNHPKIICQGVKDFGTVLFLDVECRIVQPIPSHWKAPLVSMRSPLQHFWIKYNTGTVMVDEECLPWLESWIHIMHEWDMGNLPPDAFIYWKNDICDELAFNAAVTAFQVDLVTPLLEYSDRSTKAEITRGLWKNEHTIVNHPTIHHWPKENNLKECKKLFTQNFPGNPDEMEVLMKTEQPELLVHDWVFSPLKGTYGPTAYYESSPRKWIMDVVELTSAQR